VLPRKLIVPGTAFDYHQTRLARVQAVMEVAMSKGTAMKKEQKKPKKKR
jgi:hypothetical protein